jgi:hypothetical protein
LPRLDNCGWREPPTTPDAIAKPASSVPTDILADIIMAVAKTFTPELIANGRHRYENTDEPVASIAADFGVDRRTFDRYVHRWGWTPRRQRPPHGMSPLASLLEESKGIPAPQPRPNTAPVQPVDEGMQEGAQGGMQEAALGPQSPSRPSAEVAADIWAERRAAMIERMWRAVEAELGAVERMRAQLGAQPQSAGDAEKTARTVESIMRTLKELDRLRFAQPAAMSAAEQDDIDDLPRDLDEFRRALAERIDAFVASELERERSEEAAGASVDLAR